MSSRTWRGRPPESMKFSEMISNQSNCGWCSRMWAKCTVRNPSPRPRFGCPRRGSSMAIQDMAQEREATGERCGVRRWEDAPAYTAGGGTLLGILLGSFPEFLPGLLHGRFEVLAGDVPRLVLEGHGAAA